MLINCVLFVVGLVLAFAFVRYSDWLQSSRLPQTVSLENVTFPSTRSGLENPNRSHYGTVLSQNSTARRIRMLAEALRAENKEQMGILRLEELRAIPDYRSRILPKLKLVALEELLARFSEADWRTWPIGSLDIERKPTAARHYVDSLWQINSDIASFTETAAYLLHGMFSAISNGKTYPIRQDLQFLMMNAEEVLSARRSAAREGESAFDSGILQNPSIFLSFERIRGELTKRFIKEHPYQRESHFTLLLDLDPRVFDVELRSTLKESLQNLSLNASAGYRAEVLPAVVDSRVLSLLASENRSLARALAQLYLVGSVDAIEAGRAELAERLLLRSESTYGGLEAQEVLSAFIRKQQRKSIDETTKPSPSILAGTSEAEAKASTEIGWLTLVLLTIVGFGLLYGLRVILEQRSTRQVSGGLRAAKIPKKSGGSDTMSDPNAVDFDTPSLDEDIDFDLSQAVNR